MGSESNKINDGTGFQPSEPTLCANGCGFFGTAATMGMCSKCYRDFRINEEQAAFAKAAMEKLVTTQPAADSVAAPSSPADLLPEASVEKAVTESGSEPKVAPPNRCLTCRKRVGVMGFKCRCGSTFCGTHRYPEQHDCSFDFKAQGRDSIAKANPVVKADKIEKRV